MSQETLPHKWQPVMLILNRRLECQCGALAIFVTGKRAEEEGEYNSLEEVDVWCQECFTNAQQEGGDNDGRTPEQRDKEG